MKSTLIIILITVNFLFSNASLSYNVLMGKIIHKETKQPIPDANVYISHTTRGSTTNKYGVYEIKNISGKFWLVVSHVAFKDTAIEIHIDNERDYTFNFELTPRVYQINPIIVIPDYDRIKNTDRFIKAFIGTSENAKYTYIQNTSHLEFKVNNNNVLKAIAHEPLIITNKALGYKIEYSLFHFVATDNYVKYTGFPKFHYLKSNQIDSIALWNENRRRTYLGSLRHFLYAICKNYEITAGNLEEPVFKINVEDETEDGYKLEYANTNYLIKNGFEVLYTSSLKPEFGISPITTIINTNNFLFQSDTKNEFYLKFKNFWEIRYNTAYLNDKTKHHISWITLENDSVLIDNRGRYYQTFGIKLSGYWSKERMADMLPYEYSLEDK